MKVIESGFALNMVDAGLIYWKMERRRWKMMIKFYKILKPRNKIKNDIFIVINNNVVKKITIYKFKPKI